jgi:glycosyltransferase involved in cell wall biosynthesis
LIRIHLIYPHGPAISCPDAIGRHLADCLRKRYEVHLFNWDELRAITPAADGNDVLIGHPHPAPWTIFQRSVKRRGWRRVLMLSPFHHGDIEQVAFLYPIIQHCDLYLAITGNYWFSSITNSTFSHWQPKMIHLDLAVDRNDFPVIKTQFNPPGQRRFLYIGHSGWTKNTDYLGEITRLMPETQFAWMGSGPQIPGLKALGRQDFRTDTVKSLVAAHDFLITVGRADANPATILEAMAWGLIPICTPQSGYSGYPGIVNIPLDDAEQAVSILRELQALPESHLHEIQAANWKRLDQHFNWDRFSGQVIDAIESDASPALDPESRERHLLLRRAFVTSPYFYLRPRNLRPWIRAFASKILTSLRLAR